MLQFWTLLYMQHLDTIYFVDQIPESKMIWPRFSALRDLLKLTAELSSEEMSIYISQSVLYAVVLSS